MCVRMRTDHYTDWMGGRLTLVARDPCEVLFQFAKVGSHGRLPYLACRKHTVEAHMIMSKHRETAKKARNFERNARARHGGCTRSVARSTVSMSILTGCTTGAGSSRTISRYRVAALAVLRWPHDERREWRCLPAVLACCGAC